MKQSEVNSSICVETIADLQFNGAVGGREETRERPSHPPNAWADKAVNCSSSSSIRKSNKKQTTKKTHYFFCYLSRRTLDKDSMQKIGKDIWIT